MKASIVSDDEPQRSTRDLAGTNAIPGRLLQWPKVCCRRMRELAAMDASESDTGADRAAAEPVNPGPGASQPGDAAPAAAQADQPGDAALAVAQAALPGDVELAATIRSVDEGQVQEGVPL